MKNYKLFLPPDHLAEKGRENWNKKEAEEYKEWLLSVIDERTSELINYFDEKESSDIQDFLTRLGKKIADKLKEPDFSISTGDRKKLTNKGYALAADIGLLTAKYLLRDCGNKLYWTIIRKPKREMSYNLPVLEIKDFNYFDPVGGSIAEATAVINNEETFDTWFKAYLFWKDKAK